MKSKQTFKLCVLSLLLAEVFLSQINVALAADSYIGSGAQASIEQYLCHPSAPPPTSGGSYFGATTQAAAASPAGGDLYACINNIYRFAIVLAVIISVLFIVIAGYLYMSSDGNQESVDKAKSILTSSIVALIILFIGYILLKALNPSLIQFQTIQPPQVAPAPGTSATTQTTVGAAGTTGTTNGTTGTAGTTSTTGTTGGTTAAGAHTIDQSICQASPSANCSSDCSAYSSAIAQAAQEFPVSGVGNTAALIQSIMANESSCQPGAASAANSYGLMQLQISTAQQYAPSCGVSASAVTSSWLTNPNNATAVICIGAAYLQSLTSSCAGVMNIAAGYNGGAKACAPSVDCTGNSCDGVSAARAWECQYDDPTQNIPNTGYNQSRQYAPQVASCYNQLSSGSSIR